MDTNVLQMQKERIDIYNDFYNNIIPMRMPVNMTIPNRIVAEYVGLDPVDFQYDFSSINNAKRELAAKIYADSNPFLPAGGITSRVPGYYQIQEANSFVMGNNGFVQHPEVIGMLPEEYPDLIKDPFECLLKKVIPRLYDGFNTDDAVGTLNRMMLAREVLTDAKQKSSGIIGELREKYGYWPGAPLGSSTMSVAPFDFIADQLRSFSGALVDVKRHRSELIEACEAILPLLYHWGVPTKPHPHGIVNTPLHMPTYMREKDFVDIWLPTYKKQTEQWAALGARTRAFCEHDWMRYLDYLLELPAGTLIQFEYGDAQKVKDKLGKKFILSGLYPLSLMKTGTKQEVLDEAKKLLDIMLPGGGYIFSFDKSPLTLGDFNLENYCALAEFLHEYAVYDNPGEKYGTPLNTENFEKDLIPLPKSKSLFNWDDFKKKNPTVPEDAKKGFQAFQKNVLSVFLELLI